MWIRVIGNTLLLLLSLFFFFPKITLNLLPLLEYTRSLMYALKDMITKGLTAEFLKVEK